MRPKSGEEKLIFPDRKRRDAMKARLYRLYIVERRGSIEIAGIIGVATHKSILRALHKYGIPVRGVGESAHVTCIEPGCHQPIYRILHKGNGSWYGRRCYLHWVVFRFRANQPKGEYGSWQRRNRRLLQRARKLVRLVSSTLNAASKPAWTSRT